MKRLAVFVFMAVLICSACAAECAVFARPNPEFVEWQRRRARDGDSGAARTRSLSSDGEARALLAYRFGKRPEAVSLPNVTVESQRYVKDRVTREPGRWLLRLVAEGNAVEGEAVASKLECYPSGLIYKENEVLYSHTFTPDTSRQEIEETVFQALKTLNQNAVGRGILRDPISGNVGSIDTAEFLDALDHITEVENNISLEIVAARDIYTEGPLRVKFILK